MRHLSHPALSRATHWCGACSHATIEYVPIRGAGVRAGSFHRGGNVVSITGFGSQGQLAVHRAIGRHRASRHFTALVVLTALVSLTFLLWANTDQALACESEGPEGVCVEELILPPVLEKAKVDHSYITKVAGYSTHQKRM
jgi:hypothetical protein